MIKKIKSWDSIWEKVHKSQDWGKYPPEELIKFIARNFYQVPDRKKVKILDIGCGTGAGAWYIAREGFSVWGIDGSKSAVKKAQERFKKDDLEGNFKTGDFINLDYPDGFFDCVVDICSIQCNKKRNIRRILKEFYRVLKPEGKVFSMLVNKKTKLVDQANTFEGKGFTYFFNRKETLDLFSQFKNLKIEISERTDKGNFISHFIVMAQK